MMFPTIHLNGTAARDLLEDQLKAMRALRSAIEVLQQTGPNGRDYYPQSAMAFQHARDEHEQRILQLRNILAELEAIAEHVSKSV